MPGSTTPKIFLSFASEDDPWIRWFVKDIWFTKQIGNVRLQDYAAGDNLEFGELGQWVDEHVDEAAAVVAFISQYYMQKKWTVEELKKTMTAFRRKRPGLRAFFVVAMAGRLRLDSRVRRVAFLRDLVRSQPLASILRAESSTRVGLWDVRG